MTIKSDFFIVDILFIFASKHKKMSIRKNQQTLWVTIMRVNNMVTKFLDTYNKN